MITYLVEGDTHWRATTDTVGKPDETAVAFSIDTGIDDQRTQANVLSAVARNLPPAPMGLKFAQPVHVYANGPSAKTAPRNFPALALNGAYALFPDGPEMWAALDSGVMVTDFLRDPKARTRHLVASKCDPAVFDALQGHDVSVWHVGDCGSDVLAPGNNVILPGTTITTTVMGLLMSMGVREVHVYGWDCCYGQDGQPYAVPQNHDTSHDITVDIGGKIFHTATKWAAEVQTAIAYMSHLSGMSITVHGDGMMRAAMAFAFQERQEAA